MKAGQAELAQIANAFSLDIIYALGSQANAVAEWLGGLEKELPVSTASDVDVGIKPSAAKSLSVKEKGISEDIRLIVASGGNIIKIEQRRKSFEAFFKELTSRGPN